MGRPRACESTAWLPTIAAATLAALLGGAGAQTPEEAVLAEGNPPLRQADVDAWRRLVETAFGAPLTAEQSAGLQEQLVALWRTADNPARSQLVQAAAAWARLGATQGAEQETLRLALREELLDAARRDPEAAVSKLVTGLYDATSPVLAEGPPPLRRGSAEALVALFEWLASRAGGAYEPLTAVERDRFTAHLVQHYPHTAPGDRMLLQHMEETLAWLQLQWERAGPEGQANFRANLARALGIEGALPPAPFAGPTDTWEHPDGVFSVDYPADWPARYGALPEGTAAGGWALLDVSLLGDAPSEALELAALPAEGAMIAVAAAPADLTDDRLTIEEAVVALAHDLLSPFGAVEPLTQPVIGEGAVLSTWTQQSPDGQHLAWISVVLLPRPRGAAVVTLCRAPAARKADIEPALSRVLYSLRTSDTPAQAMPDLRDFPSTRDLTLDLLNTPFPEQMDLIEGLAGGGE